MEIAAIEKLLNDRSVSLVRVGGFDLDGVLRGKYISKDKFLSALKDGFGFCDVIFGWDVGDNLYDRGTFTGWHTGFPDLLARIVPSTVRVVPWEPNTAFALAEFHKRDGSPLPYCPRQTLKRIVSKAESMGYSPKMAAEYEWFLFEETPETALDKSYRGLTPESPGMFCYSLMRASARSEFIHLLSSSLRDFGIEIEGIHTETGPGAFEACIKYGDALASADNAALFKTIVKEIASKKGLMASFMAKAGANLPGCGGHIHQSLANRETGANLFAKVDDGRSTIDDSAHASNDPSSIVHRPSSVPASDLAMHYIAGQQRLLPEILPLICPTVNSYKRLVPGFWAPTTATWGIENRTNSIRLIPGASSKATRIESRIPGADANPYFAMAACLAAGLYGIENQLEPTAPTAGNAYDETQAIALPRNLGEATARMRNSVEAAEWFGEEFVDHFCTSREWESREFDKAVTDWELRRYFEII